MRLACDPVVAVYERAQAVHMHYAAVYEILEDDEAAEICIDRAALLARAIKAELFDPPVLPVDDLLA